MNPLPALTVAFALARLAPVLMAQCALQSVPLGGYGGVQGIVQAAVEWDPDGVGPSGPVLVLGGGFAAGGGTPAANLVTFDPATGAWGNLLGGCNDLVFALAVMPNGDLVAGGRFTQAGTTAAGGIARWNGTTWTALGAGIAGLTQNEVRALAVLPNGDLVAGGAFLSIGGVAAHHVARWNGTTWSSLAGGVAWPGAQLPYVESVTSLAALPNGDLIAGGWFTSAGGTPAVGIARWNGAAWSALGGSVNSAVHAILPMPNGDLIVGGAFGVAGGAPAVGIARWNGAVWSALGTGMQVPNGSGQVLALTRLPNGDVVATGTFATAGGIPAANIARWNGTAWSAFGAGLAAPPTSYLAGLTVTTLAGGELIVGGAFRTAGGLPAAAVAQWATGVWTPLARGWNGATYAFARRHNGELVAGGAFSSAGTVLANGVAAWNGAWAPLGTGTGGPVRALTIASNDDVVAAGDFTTAGGVNVSNVARWNGTAWSAMGLGLPGTVNALATLHNGDLVAGGNLPDPGGAYVRRWNGTAWVQLGGSFPAGFGMTVRALVVMQDGDLVASGTFPSVGGVTVRNIARWDGVAWSDLGGGLQGEVEAVAVLDTGDLVAAGQFTTTTTIVAPHVARWDGSTWHAMASGTGFFGYATSSYSVLLPLPGGQVLLGGSFVLFDGLTTSHLVRWDGASWAAMPGTDLRIRAMHELVPGRFAVAGDFGTIAGQVSPFFAELATPCPASSVVTGAGCSGSAGANVLAATTLPWSGSTCRSLATGMPTNGLALSIVGLGATSIPLATILPQSGAGCSLLATPDVLALALPLGGSVATAIAIPNTAALVGGSFLQQVAAIELDAFGNLVAVTTTNALAQSIGAL